MKQNINEIKRLQQLAGVINESQLSEDIEKMYYIYDTEGMEEPIGPFSLGKASEELLKYGQNWAIMDEKTAKEVYSHLDDDIKENYNKPDNNHVRVYWSIMVDNQPEDVVKILTDLTTGKTMFSDFIKNTTDDIYDSFRDELYDGE